MQVLSRDGLGIEEGLSCMVPEHRQMPTGRGQLNGFDAGQRRKRRGGRRGAGISVDRWYAADENKNSDKSVDGRHGLSLQLPGHAHPGNTRQVSYHMFTRRPSIPFLRKRRDREMPYQDGQSGSSRDGGSPDDEPRTANRILAFRIYIPLLRTR